MIKTHDPPGAFFINNIFPHRIISFHDRFWLLGSKPSNAFTTSHRRTDRSTLLQFLNLIFILITSADWNYILDIITYYHARYPTDDWHLAYMFSLIYISVEVCLEGVFPHSVSTRRHPCVRVYAPPPPPLTLASPLTKKTKSNRGDPTLHLHHLYCTVYGVCHRQNYGLKVVFWLKFYCLPLSSLCKTTHRYWVHINVCRVSCGGVFNMLLVLSITFYFHYNIWGCVCSTRPFQYRLLKGYIYSSCYYHQIGSIHLSHYYHILFVVVFVTSYSVTYCIYVPGKPGICK